MKFSLLLVCLLIVASATSAMAAGPYIGASGGLSIFHDSDLGVSGQSATGTVSYDSGFGFNLSGGYNIDPVRIEGEFGYKNANVDKFSVQGSSQSVNNSELTVLSYMLNGFYDIKTESAITPFIGAGLGVVRAELIDPGEKTDINSFGYQLSLGAAYKVNKTVNIDISYRFQGASSDFSKNGLSVSYHSSNILAGVRYNF